MKKEKGKEKETVIHIYIGKELLKDFDEVIKKKDMFMKRSSVIKRLIYEYINSVNGGQ